MAEYLFENLDGVPSVPYIEHKIAGSIATEYDQASYHPEENWLKLWFVDALTAEEEAFVAQYVDESIGKVRFRTATGCSFFEFQALDQNKWQKHSFRVDFGDTLPAIPQIRLWNAAFNGTADIEVVNVTQRYFDFRVTSTRSKSKSQFNSVEFEWEAVAWLA